MERNRPTDGGAGSIIAAAASTAEKRTAAGKSLAEPAARLFGAGTEIMPVRDRGNRQRRGASRKRQRVCMAFDM